MHINPYLNFNGQCEAAFKFYEKCLGGKIEGMFKFGESPMAEQMPPEARNNIMPASLRAGDAILMGSDAPGEQFQKPQGFAVSINVKTVEEAQRVFHALSEGGQVQLPIQETFWAQRFGMLVDQFGIPWMVNCEKSH